MFGCGLVGYRSRRARHGPVLSPARHWPWRFPPVFWDWPRPPEPDDQSWLASVPDHQLPVVRPGLAHLSAALSTLPLPLPALLPLLPFEPLGGGEGGGGGSAAAAGLHAGSAAEASPALGGRDDMASRKAEMSDMTPDVTSLKVRRCLISMAAWEPRGVTAVLDGLEAIRLR